MMANIDNAVTNGLANGMSGLMVADWGDGGHPNPWVVSVPAIVYAAHRMRGEALSRHSPGPNLCVQNRDGGSDEGE